MLVDEDLASDSARHALRFVDRLDSDVAIDGIVAANRRSIFAFKLYFVFVLVVLVLRLPLVESAGVSIEATGAESTRPREWVTEVLLLKAATRVL